LLIVHSKPMKEMQDGMKH